MKNIAIFGAGGFGREVKMLIDHINAVSPQWNFIGYFDDDFSNAVLIDEPYRLGGMDALNAIHEKLYLVLAIGNPLVKRKILHKIHNRHIHYPVLIHPNVVMGNSDVTIGDGCIICAGTILTVDIKIGKHVILNLACTVGHDTIIHDFCSFMPSVNISGEVLIEEAVYVGTGAKIINQLEIGAETVVGAGAVVSKSLPPKCTAVGVPAKPIRFQTD
ncbi:MAG TPA: acetyltransferase [Ferruginibacter sp.]|nr:acetyltransferase [Ferruginibacter sp.]HRO17809.1 acetyltransferase [Ferruginibacter sp.]HRQ21244.1 acetyltransferase [Ferruginibacter sp.]